MLLALVSDDVGSLNVIRFVELGSKSKCGLSSTTPFVIS